ncbi:MAG: hypothetical protein K2H70_02765, partial [Bacteroidales bacterium]|nr:hypothetical protein [Bacteroidales bacterium]
FIVPVPLHPDKLKKRGYNQADLLGRGMAAAWGQCVAGMASRTGEVMTATADTASVDGRRRPVLLTDLLFKRRMNESQTRKNRSARWDNVQSAYDVSGRSDLRARVAGKHLLLVDDVLTTGATLESAASALLAACPGVSLSVAVAATPV